MMNYSLNLEENDKIIKEYIKLILEFVSKIFYVVKVNINI